MSESVSIDLNMPVLQAIADSFPVPVMIISESGNVLQVIGDQSSEYSRKLHETCGKSLYEIWPSVKAEGFLAMIRAVIDDNTAQSVEYWLSFGEVNRCYEAHISPLAKLEGSTSPAVLWVAFDVTERKRMEAALQSRDQLLDGIAYAKTVLLSVNNMDEAIPRALATIGHASRVERAYLCRWHDRLGMFMNHYGWTTEEDEKAFRPPSDTPMEGMLPEWSERLQQNGVVRIRINKATGKKRDYLKDRGIQSMILLPIWVQLEFWGFLGLDDTSEDRDWEYSEVASLRVAAGSIGAYILNKHGEELLKQAKNAADAANAAKGEFLAMMSHEIRTPMNSILGFADLLQKGKLGEQEREYVDIINRSGKTLLELINNILDYSKIESRGIELENEPFNLERTIMEALELLLVKAKQKGIELVYDITGDDVKTFMGDSDRLRQVLINLVNNSIKFTDEGVVSLKVDVSLLGMNEYVVKFRVEDTGIGIPEDKINMLFQPFSQIDHSKSRRYGGTGLGLVICKRLVTKMGGEIGVESTYGEGSVFHFNIILEKLHEGPPRKEIHSDALFHADFHDKHPLKLLLFESSELTHSLEKQLGYFGYTPELVSDEKKVLDFADKNRRSVIILNSDKHQSLLNQLISKRDSGESDCWIMAYPNTANEIVTEVPLGVNEQLPYVFDGSRMKEILLRAYEELSKSNS